MNFKIFKPGKACPTITFLIICVLLAREGGARPFAFTAGIAANSAAAGILAEARVQEYFGVRAVGAWVFGLGSKDGSYFLRRGDLLFGGILSPSLHLPLDGGRITPFLWAGPSWSHYHWEHGLLGQKGDLADIAWGWGGGCAFNAGSSIRLEAAFWLNRDYTVNRTLGRKSKGRRLWLPMPFLSCSYIF